MLVHDCRRRLGLLISVEANVGLLLRLGVVESLVIRCRACRGRQLLVRCCAAARALDLEDRRRLVAWEHAEAAEILLHDLRLILGLLALALSLGPDGAVDETVLRVVLNVVLEGRVGLFCIAEVVMTSTAMAAAKVEVHLIKRHVEGLRCELVERVLMCLRSWHPSALVGVNLCGLVAFVCLLVRLA